MKNSQPLPLGRFIDPSRDPGFKALFCDAENLDVLKILINSFLPSSRRVTDLEFASDREVQGFTASEKVIHVDLRCRDEHGRTFIVEMQRQPQASFIKRCLEYSTRIYSSQLQRNGEYEDLMPVYIISLMKHPLREDIPGKDKAIARYSFCELEDKSFAFDDISLIFARLDMAKNSADECANDGERCLFYLAHMYDMTEIPEDEVFTTLFRKAEIAALDPEKRDKYIADMISERDYENILKTARLDGNKEGFEKGREEGQRQERLTIARALLRNGASMELVSTSTGLTIDEIRSKLCE